MTDIAATGPTSLWRQPDFIKLWAAQSVSSVGARISREGLAFAAVMSLGATPAQIGILAALVRGPAIFVGLSAGGLVDRRRRRPILIGADLGRALILASMPVAAWLHLLSLFQVYAVAAVVGALSVLFDIADHAYLPTLIETDQLVDGNAKLAATEGLAEIGGPALYGVLFQFLTAPIAIAVNAGTYVFSAAALGLIRSAEPAPPRRAAQHGDSFADDFRTGVATISGNLPVAWLLVMSTASALFGSFFSALYVIFALKQLTLSAGMLGATVAVGGVAALFGAALAQPVIRRLGLGTAFVVTGLIAGLGALFIPLAQGGPLLGMVMLMGAQVVGDSFGTVTEIAGRSLRQSLVPRHLMGRVGGVFAAAPGFTGVAGAIVSGWLGGAIGIRQTLYIACAGLIASSAVGLASPLMRRTALRARPISA